MAEFKMAAINQVEYRMNKFEVFLSNGGEMGVKFFSCKVEPISQVWVSLRGKTKVAESKMAEFKMAEFKMAAIIKLIRLN